VQFDFTQKSVFIMVGYPGSGKSTLAKKICEECHCEYLSSDEIREKVFASKRFDTAGDKAVDGLRQQAYQLMYDTAATLLRQGRKVVLDATHLEPKKRQPVVQQLTKVRQSNQFCYVLVTTPVEEIDQRMQQRAAEIHNPGESLYDAWKRVYGYFEANRQKGLLSWPDPQQEKIDCITYEELSFQLA
jgi:predicted kinase